MLRTLLSTGLSAGLSIGLSLGFVSLSAAVPARADTLSALHGRYVIAPSSRIAFSVAQVGGGGIDGVFSRFSGSFDLRLHLV